jgi:hypothetical protein
MCRQRVRVSLAAAVVAAIAVLVDDWLIECAMFVFYAQGELVQRTSGKLLYSVTTAGNMLLALRLAHTGIELDHVSWPDRAVPCSVRFRRSAVGRSNRSQLCSARPHASRQAAAAHR